MAADIILPPSRRGKPKCPHREQAKLNNDTYYFTGKACKNGHIAKRRTFNGGCMECQNTRYARNGEDYTLKSKYNITVAEKEALLLKQGGVCALCGNNEVYLDAQTKKIKKLSVDHCHKTGKIRGILCSPCNMGIGLLKHSPELLRKAAWYCE